MPLRTCLVTGKKADPSAFFRFTSQNGCLVFDQNIKKTGRGGYVQRTCDSIHKLKRLEKKVSYFLKQKTTISETIIDQQIQRLSSIDS